MSEIPKGPRPEVIRELTHAAFSAMSEISEGTSSDEILSACFTVASHAMQVVLEQGGDRQSMRHTLEMMLLQCADPQQLN